MIKYSDFCLPRLTDSSSLERSCLSSTWSSSSSLSSSWSSSSAVSSSLSSSSSASSETASTPSLFSRSPPSFWELCPVVLSCRIAISSSSLPLFLSFTTLTLSSLTSSCVVWSLSSWSTLISSFTVLLSFSVLVLDSSDNLCRVDSGVVGLLFFSINSCLIEKSQLFFIFYFHK